ncbi:MAG: GNAT family N-acetyltransferase [Caldithrix sp.]|nr:MAG: GNAT family N-acetyltransferase [Caldithrix sp.]
MDFYRHVGELIFGTRLKRLSEKFLFDVGKVYKSLDIDFEPSWFPIFYLLNKNREMSAAEMAEELAITHQAVSQLVTILEIKKVIKILQDNNDKRKRLIVFTKKGLTLMDTVKPVWKSMEKALQKLFGEGANSAYLLHALDEFEDSLKRKGLYSRIMEDIKTRQVEDIKIMHYDSEYKSQFKSLMLSWLIDNYDSDILDVGLLNYPEKKIVKNGDLILLVKVNDQIVGTIVTQGKEKATTNILYLVVDENWQKRELGKKLLLEAINRLEAEGVKTIQVMLDRKFTHAAKLFKSNGFVSKTLKNDKGPAKVDGTKLFMELNLER